MIHPEILTMANKQTPAVRRAILWACDHRRNDSLEETVYEASQILSNKWCYRGEIRTQVANRARRILSDYGFFLAYGWNTNNRNF